MPVVRIKRTAVCDPSLPLPSYETRGAAGADLRVNLPPFVDDNGDPAQTVIPARSRKNLATGLLVELEPGWEMQVRSRSGLAYKHGIAILNSPGTIDSDYRGEIGLIMVNHSDEDYVVRHGDRMAQAIIAPASQGTFTEMQELSETDRGHGGFGSTGIGSESSRSATVTPFCLLPGDRIRHRKRRSTYKVLRILSLPVDLAVQDGMIITGRQVPAIIEGLEEVVGEGADTEKVGIQVSGVVPPLAAPWLLYCAEADPEDGIPRFWLRAAWEFEERFDIIS